MDHCNSADEERDDKGMDGDASAAVVAGVRMCQQGCGGCFCCHLWLLRPRFWVMTVPFGSHQQSDPTCLLRALTSGANCLYLLP
jgi:hypothetical protein